MPEKAARRPLYTIEMRIIVNSMNEKCGKYVDGVRTHILTLSITLSTGSFTKWFVIPRPFLDTRLLFGIMQILTALTEKKDVNGIFSSASAKRNVRFVSP